MKRSQHGHRPLKILKQTGKCRECGQHLTTPATVKRQMCRSCWRVAKVLK